MTYRLLLRTSTVGNFHQTHCVSKDNTDYIEDENGLVTFRPNTTLKFMVIWQGSQLFCEMIEKSLNAFFKGWNLFPKYKLSKHGPM